MDLFNTVSWNFTDTEYESAKDFNANFLKHQIKNGKEASSWNPDEIVIENEAVDIVFMAWIEKNALAENETLLEEEDFFDDESKSELGLFQANIQARLYADNGKNLPASELMYKLDEQMKPKELGDEHCFEGLGALQSDTALPKFYLFCGTSKAGNR